jgi:hypothetical protein
VTKKFPHKNQSERSQPHLFWLATGTVILIVAITLITWASYNPGSGREDSGTPKLVVDQTSIDEGNVKFDTPVRTTFRLRNEGDGLLRIQGC